MSGSDSPRSRVFISYRRDDSQHVAGRLFDRLLLEFRRADIFKDVDSIPSGDDFREHLQNAVGGCDIMLVLIGDNWASAAGSDGSLRLDNPDDFVRLEIEAALERAIRVVPVLIGNAELPPENRLPQSLQPLRFRQAIRLRPDPDFDGDAARLIRTLKPNSLAQEGKSAKRPFHVPIWAALVGVLLITVTSVLIISSIFKSNNAKLGHNSKPAVTAAAAPAGDAQSGRTDIKQTGDTHPTNQPIEHGERAVNLFNFGFDIYAFGLAKIEDTKDDDRERLKQSLKKQCKSLGLSFPDMEIGKEMFEEIRDQLSNDREKEFLNIGSLLAMCSSIGGVIAAHKGTEFETTGKKKLVEPMAYVKRAMLSAGLLDEFEKSETLESSLTPTDDDTLDSYMRRIDLIKAKIKGLIRKSQAASPD